MLKVFIIDVIEREGTEIDDVFQKNSICLYIVYAKERALRRVPLYAGYSTRPWRRLRIHMQLESDYSKETTALGDLLTWRAPKSNWYGVEFYTKTECAHLIEVHKNAIEELCQVPASSHIPEEMALIEELHPCLNYEHNTNATPLPTIFNVWKEERKNKWFWLM